MFFGKVMLFNSLSFLQAMKNSNKQHTAVSFNLQHVLMEICCNAKANCTTQNFLQLVLFQKVMNSVLISFMMQFHLF